MSKQPKEAFQVIDSDIGGVQLLENFRITKSHKRKTDSVAIRSKADEIFSVMQKAHTQDPAHKFVRDIKTAPEPEIALADDQQLQDLVRFATSSVNFGIVTIDPTFSLGEFDVTPITYRHRELKLVRYFWVQF